MDQQDDPFFFLGAGPAREGQNPSDGYPRTGLQVDAHPLTLLAGS